MWVRNNKGNVFVGNLPPDFPDERLAEAFDPFGIVLTAAVARDPSTGARLRYGFVDIATERAAAAPPRTMPAPAAEPPPRRLQSQSAQSQLAREGLPEIEPPPRTDFEIVR